MPNLPLDRPEAFAATLGVMLSPGEDEDSQKRARTFAARILGGRLQQFREAGHEFGYQDLARIASDSGMVLGQGEMDQCWWDGSATGEIFKVLFILAQTDPSRASWTSATKLAEATAARHGVRGSRTSLYAARSRYLTVAHLWAAWSIRERRFHSNPSVGYEGWHDFQLFLAEAEFLRRWGQSWRPARAKSEPPLPAEVWHVPDGWEPPERQSEWPMTGRIPVMKLSGDLIVDLRGPGRPRIAG